MSPRTIAEYGARREKVRVFIQGELVRVRWRVAGKRFTKSYPNTPDGRATAKAFARGIVEERENPTRQAKLTLRELWEHYSAAEFPELRQRTRAIYGEYWSRWEAMWGRDFIADQTTLDMVHQFRRALTKLGLAVTTVRKTIQTAQMVYAWGERNELLDRNKLRLYRFKTAKEERPKGRAEYRRDDFARILEQLDPKKSTQWRAYVALVICGSQGVRQRSALHLKWTDLALELEPAVVTWRAEWDKLGREWTQPLRALTLRAIAIAQEWRDRMRYEGEWVIPAGSSKSTKREGAYSPQSLWLALKGAEARAGIPHEKGRGAHGLRRMLMGDVAAATGDAALGLLAIGDTDLRMATVYMKRRDDRISQAFEQLDRAEEERARAPVSAPDPDPESHPEAEPKDSE